MPLVYAQLCLSEMPVLTHISTGKHQCGESTNTVPAKVALPRGGECGLLCAVIILVTKIEKKISGVMKPVSAGKRLVTAVVMCGLLVGVSGCDNHSVLSGSGKSVGKSSTSASASEERDPNRIYANHDKGVDPKIKHFDSPEAYDEYTAVLGKWGVRQTPDWLEICNQVNVPAMRTIGFDPQKDLQNRETGQSKSMCYWLRDHDRLQFFSAKKIRCRRFLIGKILIVGG